MKALAWVAAAAWVGACSSPHTNHPPELGDCLPSAGSPCTSPPLGGGMPSNATSTGPPDAGTTATTCGGADALVVTMNGYCQPCIVSTLCCQADQGCNSSCQAILLCTQKCAQGDSGCVSACETDPTAQAGVTAYLDFAACLSANCAACPTLQQ